MTATLARHVRRPQTSMSATERRDVWAADYSSQSPTAASSAEVFSTMDRAPEPRSVPTWLPDARRRMLSLALRAEGWDSYGGRALQEGSLIAFAALVEFADVIQTPPSISLTSEGGLACEWRSGQFEIELTSSPDYSIHVYFADGVQEWEGRLEDCTYLEKWLWQASKKPNDA